MKIVSYNLNHRMTNDIYKYKIIDLLMMMQADVILLQEITDYDDVKFLAKYLEMNCSRGAHSKAQTAIISREKIEDTFLLEIPESSWNNTLIGVKISFPINKKKSLPIWIYNVHLDDLRYMKNEKKRLFETRFIIKNIEKNSGDCRIVIGGDFNSPSHLDLFQDEDEEIKTLLPSHWYENKHYIDLQADKSWKRSTWIPSKSKKMTRIDRIYVKGEFKIGKGGIYDKKDFDMKKWPTGSDHRLVWNEIVPKEA